MLQMDMQLQQQGEGDEFVLPDLNIPAGEDE